MTASRFLLNSKLSNWSLCFSLHFLFLLLGAVTLFNYLEPWNHEVEKKEEKSSVSVKKKKKKKEITRILQEQRSQCYEPKC